MGRLTEWRGEHAAIVDHHANYIDKLARYEDAEERGNSVQGMEWISVEDRLPDTPPGEILPRNLVYTKYGVTEGWYDPELGYWFALLWFMTPEFKNYNIDFVNGDIPKLGIKVPVKAWMPYPEPPKEE